MSSNAHTATLYTRILWILIGTFQYGYHISSYNSAQNVMSCKDLDTNDRSGWDCVPMSDAVFGVVTASYTLGGLFGSFFCDRLVNSNGQKRTILYGALFICLGSVVQALSGSPVFLFLGRLISGIGCGINLCVVPLSLSANAPPKIKGFIGVTNQLAICIGILTGQAVSLALARLVLWRLITCIPAGVALLQLLTSATYRDPVSTDESVESGTQEPLLGDRTQNERNERNERNDVLSISDLFKSKDPVVRRGLVILLITQLTQQASGINAVMYYSTSILSKVIPQGAQYMALFITVVNLVSTFPTAILIDKLGRKSLLLISGYVMCVSHALLAYAVNDSLPILSSISIIGAVIGFSLGLGPVPFIIIDEIMPANAANSAASLGLSANWVANFAVGSLFLPLRNAMSGKEGNNEGNVFIIFAVIVGISSLTLNKLYK